MFSPRVIPEREREGGREGGRGKGKGGRGKGEEERGKEERGKGKGERVQDECKSRVRYTTFNQPLIHD